MGEHYTDTDIAIIGMAGRFPGAPDLNAFWSLLRDGAEGIVDLDDETLDRAGIPAALRDDPNYVKRAPMLADIDRFDDGFWGMSPREAAILDPQQRIFLECVWEAFESAGCIPQQAPGRVGVFAGVGVNTYLLHNLLSNRTLVDAMGEYALMLASDKDYLATRVAFKLGLQGPALSVQTACSTSLVAVHLAVQSLLNGESDLAVAGGVTVRVPQGQGYLYDPGMISASDGHCRAFDAAADGTVGGSGAGAVLLRRLDDARAAGDPVLAVIKGSALNNDGGRKVGYTAPSIPGQAQVIAEAQAVAEVEPDTVSYIEAHGTATRLGDPIEVAALTRAFRRGTDETGFCALGSVKSNIGHLDAAAGVAGLIKTVLALQHRELPPSLHFRSPNPQLELDSSPFYVPNEHGPWPLRAGVRRAGVSSFGIGGTNAHLILAEAPPPPASAPSWPWQVLPLSARSRDAVVASSERLAVHLDTHPEQELADVAHTLQQGRTRFDERQIAICRDRAHAVEVLRGRSPEHLARGSAHTEAPRVAFLFSGQGAQYPGMGRALYEVAEVFRDAVDTCATRLQPLLDLDLRMLLFTDRDDQRAADSLRDTAITQPALFTIEYALAQQWIAWGVRPAALLGHSIGEYAAACVAEVFSLDDALALVAERGRLMSCLPGGAMMSVAATPAQLEGRLPAGVDLAAINAPGMCVLSGSAAALDRAAEALAAEELSCRRLHVSHAFHSASMEPMLAPFAAAVGKRAASAPRLPVASNLSGDWLTPEEATDPQYWARLVRAPVRFAAGVDTLLSEGCTVLLEVGPGRALSTFARACAQGRTPLVTGSLPHPQAQDDGLATALHSLGRLWIAGVDVDWSGVHPSAQRQRVALPTYPFERQRHWIDADSQAEQFAAAAHGGRQSIEQWTSCATWEPLPDAPAPADVVSPGPTAWLVSGRDSGPIEALSDALRASDAIGERGDRVVCIDNDAPAWDESALAGADNVHLVYILPTVADSTCSASADFLALVPGLIEAASGRPCALTAIATASLALAPSEALTPAVAGARGALTVLGQEHPELRTRWLDLNFDHPAWIRAVADELVGDGASLAPLVALRGYQRFAPKYRPAVLAPARSSAFREGGTYLLTGGTGGICVELAEYLARNYQARVALLSRTASGDANRSLVTTIEAAGGQAMLLRADVTKGDELRAAIGQMYEHWGGIDGVIHAAGVSGEAALSPLLDTDAVAWERIAAVKERGTRELAQALTEYTPSWVLVMSSLSTVLGGLGMGAYASASLAQEAQVHALAQSNATRWYSVSWDGWTIPGQSGDGTTIDAAEGHALIERVLAQRALSHLVVSVSGLQARWQQWIERSDESTTELLARVERPQLGTDYAAPRTPTESKLAAIWGELLGIAQVGIHDNFFELGGHSLLATQLAARIRAAFHTDMQVRALFERPTIAGLADDLAAAELAQRLQAPPETGGEDEGQDEREEIEL